VSHHGIAQGDARLRGRLSPALDVLAAERAELELCLVPLSVAFAYEYLGQGLPCLRFHRLLPLRAKLFGLRCAWSGSPSRVGAGPAIPSVRGPSHTGGTAYATPRGVPGSTPRPYGPRRWSPFAGIIRIRYWGRWGPSPQPLSPQPLGSVVAPSSISWTKDYATATRAQPTGSKVPSEDGVTRRMSRIVKDSQGFSQGNGPDHGRNVARSLGTLD